MRMKFLIAGFTLMAMLVLLPMVNAEDPFEETRTIEPRDFSGWPLIPTSDNETMDIEIKCDIPVDIYLVPATDDPDEWTNWTMDMILNSTESDDIYKGTTHITISKDFDSDELWILIVYNPSRNESAEVTVDYNWEDPAEEALRDFFSDNCCCMSTMGAAAIVVIGLMATIIVARKRE